MSANVYRKCETGFQKPSRRDDCISILFVLAYLRNVRYQNNQVSMDGHLVLSVVGIRP